MVPTRLWIVPLASAALLGACERGPGDSPAIDETPPPTELLPVADPPLDRERLLLTVARTASDFAAGRNDRQRQLQLDGRRFEVRLRFGCEGDELPTRRWSFDEEAGVLRVRVDPEVSADDPVIAALDGGEFEAVEGFWIRRPWMLDAACPAPTPSPEETDETASPQEDDGTASDAEAPAPALAAEDVATPRVGIAHFFTAEDSRTRRRDERAYEATIRLTDGERPSATGYDLVLSGRLARLPCGRVIACAGDGAVAPPRCIVSATFDNVRLVRPDGTVVAEWSSG